MDKTSDNLSLPTDVSSDGKEIWDWAAKMGQAMSRECKIRELREGIRDLRPTCGTCILWMKSNLCPRETRVNGRRSGPSMNGYPCEKHQEEQWVTDLRKEREQEIEQLSR